MSEVLTTDELKAWRWPDGCDRGERIPGATEVFRSHEALRSLLDEVMRCTVSDGEYEIGAYLDDVDDIRGRVEFAIGRKLRAGGGS